MDGTEAAALVQLGGRDEWLAAELPAEIDADILRCLDLEGLVEASSVTKRSGDRTSKAASQRRWFSPMRKTDEAEGWDGIRSAPPLDDQPVEPSRVEVSEIPIDNPIGFFPKRSRGIVSLWVPPPVRSFYVRLTERGRAELARMRRPAPNHDGVGARQQATRNPDETQAAGGSCAFSTTCVEEAGRQNRGRKAWQVAMERAEQYVDRHPFPGVNELARRSGCNPHTMRKAIDESEILRRALAAHKLSTARTFPHRPSNDDPSWQSMVDEALRRLVECAPDAERANLNTPETREALARMASDELAKLVEDAEQQADQRTKAAARARARTPSA